MTRAFMLGMGEGVLFTLEIVYAVTAVLAAYYDRVDIATYLAVWMVYWRVRGQ